jgi:hypothetical protein
LKALGFDVVAVDGIDEVSQRCAEWSPGSISCYVQAPVEPPVKPGNRTERLGDFLRYSLGARCELAALIGPLLRPGGTFVLVASANAGGDRVGDADVWFDMLRLVADAVQGEYPGTRVLIARPQCSPGEIAELAAGRPPQPSAPATYDADADPELSYVEWRDRVLSSVGVPAWQGAVYRARDGAPPGGQVRRNGASGPARGQERNVTRGSAGATKPSSALASSIGSVLDGGLASAGDSEPPPWSRPGTVRRRR